MKRNTFYSLLFIVILLTVGTLCSSCSTNDDELQRQSELCNCTVTTTIYEDDDPTTSIISQTTEDILDDCSEDGKELSSVNLDGQLIVNSWSCQ